MKPSMESLRYVNFVTAIFITTIFQNLSKYIWLFGIISSLLKFLSKILGLPSCTTKMAENDHVTRVLSLLTYYLIGSS